MDYRILPNKGAGCVSKVLSDIVERKLRLWAFQRWFRIENRTFIKENVFILDISDRTAFLQTIGGALVREGALNRQNTVLQNFIEPWEPKIYKTHTEPKISQLFMVTVDISTD